MEKLFKKFRITFLPLLVVIALDQSSKNWARTLTEPIILWKFKLQLVFNDGILLGYFSDMPLNIKEFSLTTLGSFIFFSYLMGIWLLPIRSKATYIGLSLLTGGIMGNIIDRFNGFSVVDFLSINSFGRQSPYMNFADFIQWIGYVMIFVGLHRDSLYYWPKNDWRNKYIINAYFQIRSSLFVSLLSLLSSLIILIFSYSFFKNGQTKIVLKYFFAIGFSVSLFLAVVVFLISLVLTHRVAGPVYAVQRYVKNIIHGKRIKFTLREHDEFKELEEVFTNLNEEIPPPIPEILKEKNAA